MRKFLTKNKKTILVLIGIMAVVLIAYGQTLFMYFWQDDSAQMFRLQHPIGQMGSFGPSIWSDRGPYRYMVIPFVPFFKIFNLEPFGYFLGGLVTYFAAAVAFYLFANELFSNRRISTASAFIFAAGYVGSDMLFRIINSWQSNFGLILSVLALFFYTKFLHRKGWLYFALAVISYLGAIELVYIRSHSLIASIIILDFALRAIPEAAKNKVRAVAGFLIRMAPFVILFYFWYLRDSSFGAPGLLTLAGEILSGNAGKLMPLFATVGNAFVPSAILEKAVSMFGGRAAAITSFAVTVFFAIIIKFAAKRKLTAAICVIGNICLFIVSYALYRQRPFWYSDAFSFTSGTVGLLMSFNIFYTGIITWKREDIGRLMVVGYVMLASQVFGYYIQYPTAIFITTHRYLAFAIIGYSVFYASLLYLFSLAVFPKKRIYYLLLVLLMGVNLYLGVRYQARIVGERSIPTRVFYQNLLKDVPRIDKEAIFYFDVMENPAIQKQFNDFFSVGSMPDSTALAIYYGLDRDDITLLTNFDELISILAKDKTKIGKVYAFYYGERGLIDNTELVRYGLKNSGTSSKLEVTKKSDLRSDLLAPGHHPNSLPNLLQFTAVVDIDGQKLTGDSNKTSGLSFGQKKMILSYFDSKEEYYRTARVESLSEWKFQETGNVVDGNPDTSWRGHRIYWDDNEHDYIIIDLGKIKTVGRFVWTNWIMSLTPTAYTIETSPDGRNWSVSKEVKDGAEKKNSERVVIDISPVLARYVKMDITKTLTNDSPAISEVEVVESKYNKIDLATADLFLGSPFSFIGSYDELDNLSFNFARLVSLKITLVTDKGRVVRTLPVEYFNRAVDYTLVLQPGGTEIKDIIIETENPTTMRIVGAKVTGLSLKEMIGRGLVKNFSKN